MSQEDVEKLRFLLQEERWKIIQCLEEGPAYTGEIAKKLGYNWQKTYYHIRLLKEKGILEVVDEKNINGATAKLVALKPQNFRLSIANGFGRHIRSFPQQLFSGFRKGNKLDGIIVVGSPHPHGALNTQAKDGWTAANISWYLGRFFELPKTVILTDVELRKRKEEKNNLIVIGGPVSNIITNIINKFLPITFEGDPWGLRDTNGKIYTDPSVGLVSRIPNPQDNSKNLLILAGISIKGTQAAILAVTKEQLPLPDNPKDIRRFGIIVRGIDTEGIGEVGDVEVLFSTKESTDLKDHD
ncbi:MAG: helix-turn-helix domain-containing protein [Promethearchaeota archaeon]